jgi:hypothetical protein
MSGEYYSTITFIVRDNTLKPVKGATVKVMDVWETLVYESGVTDESGMCKITMQYNPAMYLAHAEYQGLKSYSKFVDFKTDTTVYLDLLEPLTPISKPPTPPKVKQPTTTTKTTTTTTTTTTPTTTTVTVQPISPNFIYFLIALLVIVGVVIWLSG